MKKNILKCLTIFVILALLTFATLMVFAYFKNRDASNNRGQDGTSQNMDSGGEKNANDAASFEYSGSVIVDSSAKTMSLYFKNADRSSKNLIFEVVGDINGEQISFAKTGILGPGDEVRQLDCDSAPAIESGQYNGNFILYFYDENNKKEIVNSKIDISIRIK